MYIYAGIIGSLLLMSAFLYNLAKYAKTEKGVFVYSAFGFLVAWTLCNSITLAWYMRVPGDLSSDLKASGLTYLYDQAPPTVVNLVETKLDGVKVIVPYRTDTYIYLIKPDSVESRRFREIITGLGYQIEELP